MEYLLNEIWKIAKKFKVYKNIWNILKNYEN